jgi:hypothetical protein
MMKGCIDIERLSAQIKLIANCHFIFTITTTKGSIELYLNRRAILRQEVDCGFENTEYENTEYEIRRGT